MIYYLLTFFILITFFIFNKKGKNIKIKVFKDFYTEIKLKLPKKNYEAGQFVIMDFIINDEKISRAYSLSNDQEKDGYGRFIIKKVNNGVVSNFLLDNHENIKNINFTGPFGDFVINKKTNNHVFIAGGSGITPIASILNKYLEKRKENYFFLIYGNKSYEEILLDEEIFNLSKKFNNLKIVSFTNDGSSNFIQNKKGILSYETLLENINNFNLPFKNTTFYVCGPDGVVNNCKKIFELLNIDESNVRIEKFISIQNSPKEQIVGNKKFNLTVLKDNTTEKTIKISSNNTLLNSLTENNIDINYSCMSGVCKMCKTAYDGEIKTSVKLGDEDNKKQALACCSYPLSDIKIIR
jgi:ring-1,2-phenylacetyl-CoA epoxidase subunit PaaE